MISSTSTYADIDTASDDYATRFRGPLGAWLLKVQTKAILRHLLRLEAHLGHRPTILDIGGGHGQVAVPLAERGYQVTVLGSGAVRQGALEGLVAAGTVTWNTGDLLAAPLASGSFDAVISVRLLPHVDEWQSLIQELCRLARHAVVVDYPRYQSVNILTPLLFHAKKKIEQNTRPYLLFWDRQITEEFAKQQFKRTGFIGQFFWPMAIHRLLKNPSISALLEWIPQIIGLSYLLGSPVVAAFERAGNAKSLD